MITTSRKGLYWIVRRSIQTADSTGAYYTSEEFHYPTKIQAETKAKLLREQELTAADVVTKAMGADL